MAKECKIVVVDDHTLFRNGLRTLLGRGETREVTDFVSIPRERYARIKFEPYSVELFLKYDEQGQLMVMTDLISYCHDNEKLLINTIKIFLTNVMGTVESSSAPEGISE